MLVVILWMRACQERPISQEPIIQTTTKTIYDTLTFNSNVYIPKYITRIKHDTTLQYVDTSKVIEDYYSTYYYQDVVDHDSVKIYINDSITQNKISSRQLSYNIKYPTKIITNTIVKFPKPENQYYIVIYVKNYNLSNFKLEIGI